MIGSAANAAVLINYNFGARVRLGEAHPEGARGSALSDGGGWRRAKSPLAELPPQYRGRRRGRIAAGD